MAGSIYKKPVAFAITATVVVLIGSIVTMAYPMLRPEMHEKVAGLTPLGALELAGRDIYQREGCVNCHTQTVRPLRSETVRYKGSRAADPANQYSRAGEFAYDHPFLWGSKRTGPDLAFEGWIKPSKDWQAAHLRNPQAVTPRSTMPAYAFLDGAKVDPADVQASMRGLRRVGVPYTDADLAAAPAVLQGKTEMDALVAYTVSLGRAVDRGAPGGLEVDLAAVSPKAADAGFVARGKKLFEDKSCNACHGEEAEGVEGVAPSLVDDRFLETAGDLPDGAYFAIIKGGSDVKKAIGRPGNPDGGMAAFGGELSDEDVWAIVAYLRDRKAHESAEHGKHQ